LLHGHPSSSAFMPQTSPANHHQALHGYNSGYTYTPPPGAYHLHNEQVDQSTICKSCENDEV